MEEVKEKELRDALEVVETSHYDPAIFNTVYDKVKAMIVNRTFNAANWIQLVTLCMEVAEVVPNMPGSQKSELVVDLMAKLIGEIPMADEDRAAVQAILKSALPAIIDVIVQGTLGELAINIATQVQEGAAKCFAKCKSKK